MGQQLRALSASAAPRGAPRAQLWPELSHPDGKAHKSARRSLKMVLHTKCLVHREVPYRCPLLLI